jgi:hypothetical protein
VTYDPTEHLREDEAEATAHLRELEFEIAASAAAPRLVAGAARMKVERGRKQERDAILAWLENGALRPEGLRLHRETYVAIAQLIREGWHRK